MYRHCVFCSTDLGANEVLEAFPVGRSVAFDAWRGRLWAICPRCARWNLAPIEERWEAVEAADRLFTDTRVRVQSENVGLAKMRDGTRLIRIGEALPGELAAWRYGSQLVKRRTRYVVGIAAATAAASAVVFGVPALLAAAGVGIGGLGGLANLGNVFYQHRRSQRTVHSLPAADSPTGRAMTLARWQLNDARLIADPDGGVALLLPNGARGPGTGRLLGRPAFAALTLRGAPARAVLGRAMVEANASGASRGDVARAVELLARAGDPESFLRARARKRMELGVRPVPVPNGGIQGQSGSLFSRKRPSRPEALALEMALHEESERRALEGELSALTVAWREAEEIAEIADALPFDPLDRLRGVLGGGRGQGRKGGSGETRAAPGE